MFSWSIEAHRTGASMVNMDKISHFKARVREFSEMADLQTSPQATAFYRELAAEFEDRLASTLRSNDAEFALLRLRA